MTTRRHIILVSVVLTAMIAVSCFIIPNYAIVHLAKARQNSTIYLAYFDNHGVSELKGVDQVYLGWQGWRLVAPLLLGTAAVTCFIMYKLVYRMVRKAIREEHEAEKKYIRDSLAMQRTIAFEDKIIAKGTLHEASKLRRQAAEEMRQALAMKEEAALIKKQEEAKAAEMDKRLASIDKDDVNRRDKLKRQGLRIKALEAENKRLADEIRLLNGEN